MRYDRCAHTFFAAITPAATVIFWLGQSVLSLFRVVHGRLCIADAAYDSTGIRNFLFARGTVPVIPNNPTRKQRHPFDQSAWRKRNLIERVFCRLKNLRRIATRYDRRVDVFLSAVWLAATVT